MIRLREQVAQLQEDPTIQPVVKKQAIGRPVSSRRDGYGRIPLMPRLVPNDATIWLQDRQADSQEALAQGDFPRVVQVDVRGSRPFVGVVPNRTIYLGEHGHVVCGCSPVRVVGLPSG